MRIQIKLFSFLAGLLLVTSQASAQIPKEAICAVCRVHEGATAPEKVVAMSEHLGEKYYFCSKNCKEAFDGDPEAYTPPLLPRPAPAFSLKNLQGESVSLEKLRGKVALLDFWATWCKPCVKSMPELQKLHEQYAAQGLVVLGISIDEQAEKKVPAFLAKNKITYAIALDAADKPAWEVYKVKVIPAMFLIDREGQIVQQWVGEAKMQEVLHAVQAQLGKMNKP
ncbi:MAG: redoxin domain-containing protein [bacterium]